MLRTRAVEVSLWEAVLPPEVLRLPEELARVDALLAKAADAKLLRTNRVRADTTVVPADVAYPTDSGLLARAIRRIAVTGRRIQAAGGATRTGCGTAAGRRANGPAWTWQSSPRESPTCGR